MSTSRIFIPNSHLKSLRHPVSEADGELLHLGNLQPLLLCLVLRASFHHHLEEKETVRAVKSAGMLKAMKVEKKVTIKQNKHTSY